MKIVVCAGIFPPDIGGPATYSRVLADELTKRGHKVSVVTYADSLKDDRRYNFAVQRVLRGKIKPLHYFRYFRAVKQLGKNADLLYAQDPVSAGYPTYLASRFLKKPFVVKVTGDYSWEQACFRGTCSVSIDDFQKQRSYPFYIKKIRDFQIQVCREAKLVITPSYYLKTLVRGWGVNGERVRVIYNAVEKASEIDRNQARQDLSFAPDDFFVLSAGRDVPWKGFAVLKAVFNDLAKENPKMKFKILNSASRETILRHLKAADAFVLNTAYEGFPHIILEAMIMGTPVVTTEVCGNPEIVQDGKNGILVGFNNRQQIAEAINKLYLDLPLRQALSRNARSSAEKFSLENMINQTEEILKSCAF